MWSRQLALGVASGFALILAACSGSDTGSSAAAGGASGLGDSSTGGFGANGGSAASGGASAVGGALTTGGAQITGGQSANGGNASGGRSVPSGGSAGGGKSTTGGANAAGGKSATGGSLLTGGANAAGGKRATGGSLSTGGTTSTGGSLTGGAKSTGGASSTGGTKAAGGATTKGCYTAPATQIGTEGNAARVTGYGTVMIMANSSNSIVRLQTTMVVPPKPPASGTLFLWPGLQPDGANFDPINNGVLQPVLTWGSSCAPGTQPRAYSTWWISGQYVNTYGNVQGYTGCNGGPVMSVNVCDTLDIDIALSGSVWTQTVTDVQTNQSVTYSIDMENQAQNLAYFVIEEYSSAPVSEVIFNNTTITFGSPDPSDCRVNLRGQNDYVSTPVASSDGLECSIEQIILRAQGIQ